LWGWLGGFLLWGWLGGFLLLGLCGGRGAFGTGAGDLVGGCGVVGIAEKVLTTFGAFPVSIKGSLLPFLFKSDLHHLWQVNEGVMFRLADVCTVIFVQDNQLFPFFFLWIGIGHHDGFVNWMGSCY
jgi:hypothetical protein